MTVEPTTLERLARLVGRDECSVGFSHDAAGDYAAAAEWGREAPDSPMVGAAAYATGASFEECLDMLLDEAGV